jgi:hypothetical protein
MRRALLPLLAVLLSSVAILGLSRVIAKRLCAQHLVRAGDDLAWLRREFRLGEAEMQRIRQLHEGYLPQCREMCDRIAAKKQELQTALDAGPGLTADAERKLAEVGTLRAECQTQMLRHFYDVSRAMPPEQGRRYLTEMQRLTLGFHERFEHRMSPEMPSSHGHR